MFAGAGKSTISNNFPLLYSVQAVFARGIASCGHFICVGERPKGRALVYVAGERGVLGYKGVGFGLEDAKGLRKLWRVQGKGGSEGGQRLQRAMDGF